MVLTTIFQWNTNINYGEISYHDEVHLDYKDTEERSQLLLQTTEIKSYSSWRSGHCDVWFQQFVTG